MKSFVTVAAFAGVLVSSSAAIAQEKIYALTLTNSEMSVIGNALSERPYKEVNPVITSIARQVQAQIAADEQKKTEAAKPKPESPKPDTPPANPEKE